MDFFKEAMLDRWYLNLTPPTMVGNLLYTWGTMQGYQKAETAIEEAGTNPVGVLFNKGTSAIAGASGILVLAAGGYLLWKVLK